MLCLLIWKNKTNIKTDKKTKTKPRMAPKGQSKIQLIEAVCRECQVERVGCGATEIVYCHWGSYILIKVKEAPDALQKLQHSQKEAIQWITVSIRGKKKRKKPTKKVGKMCPWLHLGVCVFCDCLFLAVHHFAASLLNENWKLKCEIPHVFSQTGLCGSHACSSGALHWCVCMCVCVYVQRRCTGWSGCFFL